MIVCWPESHRVDPGRVADALFIRHCGGWAGTFFRRELAASVVLAIPVPLLQRVTSGKRPRSNQEGLPLASGPTSSGPLAPSLFQGHAAKGHPWPIAALAASMPLNPLHNDSTRPPDGAFGVACEIGVPEYKGAQALRQSRNAWALLFSFDLSARTVQATRFSNPVRRPSGGAVERGVWHGCQTRSDGPGMALRDDPRSSTGAREVERSETRMSGALSLWLLSLSREQRESNSP